jgi:6-phosphogluconolactonase
MIRVLDTAEEVACAAARAFVDLAADATAARGRFTVALAGGATPEVMYRRLADDAALRDAVPWPQVHVFWGDERHVPPTDGASNFRMADAALLQRVPIPNHQVHRVHAEGSDAAAVARQYEATIREEFDVPARGWPEFDLILLGMGADGHTASLFPDTPVLRDASRLVGAPFVDKLGAFRITIMPGVILRARSVVVLVTGSAKAETLHAVLDGPRLPNRYPIQMLFDAEGAVTWLVDTEAAARVRRRDSSS